LQLNADEFAPPPNIYDAAEEPRPDDAWVKFYGGETRGGVKRLSPLDDEADADQAGVGGPGGGQHLPPALVAGASAPPEPAERPQEPARPPQRIEDKSLNDSPAAGARPAGSAPAPVREFPREAAPLQAGGSPAAPAKSPARGRLRAPQVEESSAGGEKTSLPPAAGAGEDFETWLKRWSPWLKRGGSVKVCRAFFDLTHGRGSPDCFTSNSVIMEITGLSRAQCIRNIHYLIEMGFLEELGESNNREAKGTYYRFHLIPRSLASL
jgi:hypothetical protein